MIDLRGVELVERFIMEADLLMLGSYSLLLICGLFLLSVVQRLRKSDNV